MIRHTSPGHESWAMRAVKQNPEGLLLLAAGCALLMRQGSASSRPAMSQRRTHMGTGRDFTQTEGARQYGSGIADQARQYGSGIAEQTRDTARAYASSMSDYAGQARRTMEETSDRFMEQAQSTMERAHSTMEDTMERVLREQPLAVALAGLAAGAAIAAAFPATRIERETLGPVHDQVARAAEQMGERLNEATTRAGETLKSAADERGLNTEGLKEVASEVADTFTSTIRGANTDSARSGQSQSRSGQSQSGQSQSQTRSGQSAGASTEEWSGTPEASAPTGAGNQSR